VSLRTLLGLLLVVNGYVLIYYRLLVRHFYQEQYGVKESTFASLFSFPPYQRLNDLGRKYARRYWVALALLIIVLLVSAFVKDGAVWSGIDNPPAVTSGATPR